MSKPRILVMRGGAIGDFIFTLPALRALKTRWPESYIELAGYPHIAGMALAGGLADMVTSLDKAETARFFSLNPLIPEEQARHIRSFDLIISYLFDPANTVKTNLLRIGARQVIYGSPVIKNGHAVDALMKPLEELAIYPDGEETPRLNLNKAAPAAGRTITEKIGKRVIAIHPGSGSPAKNWPLKNFISLADAIACQTELTPAFIIGEADSAIASELKKSGTSVPILSGHSLINLAGILSACSAYAGNDSGITHLASAVGIPVVAIFGPTDPAMWAPRGSNTKIISAAAEKKEGLSGISGDKVFETLTALLQMHQADRTDM